MSRQLSAWELSIAQQVRASSPRSIDRLLVAARRTMTGERRPYSPPEVLASVDLPAEFGVIVQCRSCQLERQSPVQMSGVGSTPPVEGDFWLCPRCASIHRFTGGWSTKFPLGREPLRFNVILCPEAELQELPAEDREHLLAVREEIRHGQG